MTAASGHPDSPRVPTGALARRLAWYRQVTAICVCPRYPIGVCRCGALTAIPHPDPQGAP